MSGTRWGGLSPAAWRMAAAGGIAAGIVYVLSPLTMGFALAMVLLVRWAANDLTGNERRWITTSS